MRQPGKEAKGRIAVGAAARKNGRDAGIGKSKELRRGNEPGRGKSRKAGKEQVQREGKQGERKRAEQDDRVFKALANRDRRSILDAIREGPLSTGEICDRFLDLDRCTVMLHLRILVAAELVIPLRRGRIRLNHLNIAPIQGIFRRWIQEYARPSADLLEHLRRRLETT